VNVGMGLLAGGGGGGSPKALSGAAGGALVSGTFVRCQANSMVSIFWNASSLKTSLHSGALMSCFCWRTPQTYSRRDVSSALPYRPQALTTVRSLP
jgi:hypothetical protein